MRSKEQLYEVEIKSPKILQSGKKSLVVYYKGGNHKTIVSNVKIEYANYINDKDGGKIIITPISNEEYQARLNGKTINHKRHKAVLNLDLLKKGVIQDETLGN